MQDKFIGMRVVVLATLALTSVLIVNITVKADPIILTTSTTNGPSLNFVSFTGGPAGASFQVFCQCPRSEAVGQVGSIDSLGNGSLMGFGEDTVDQTSFIIEIELSQGGPRVFYGPFGPSETNLQLTGQATAPEPNCTPEPTTMLLLGTGLAGVAIKTRKRLKHRKSRQGSQ